MPWSQNGPSVVYYNAGLVGIGTSTPQTTLHVNGGFTNSGGNAVFNNSVGIGTSSFDSKLTVQGPESTMRLYGPAGTYQYDDTLNFGDGAYAFIREDHDDQLLLHADRFAFDLGFVGMGVLDYGSITYRLTLPNIAGNSGRGLANRWDIYSSIRWKQNVTQISNALERVLALRGVSFDWKPGCLEVAPPERGKSAGSVDVDPRAGITSGPHDIGFIAEEVGRVLPEAVTWEPDGSGYAQGIAYDRVVPVMVEALRELRAEKDAEIAALNERLERLERQILAQPGGQP